MQSKFLKRSASFLLALVIFVSVLPIPDFQANAHEAAVIKTYIDADNMSFQTTVEYEDSGLFGWGGHEGARLLSLDAYNVSGDEFNPKSMVVGLGGQVDESWGNLVNNESVDFNGNGFSAPYRYKQLSAKELVLGWPSSGEDASASDMKRATLVGTTLTKSLNTVIKFYTDSGKMSSSAENIIVIENIMKNLDPVNLTKNDGTGKVVLVDGQNGGYIICYATGETREIHLGSTETNSEGKYISGVDVPSYDSQGNLYCYMFKGSEDDFKKINDIRDVSSTVWAMPKGTRSISGDGFDFPAIGDENLNDVAYVTMFMIAQQAIQAVYKDDNYISVSKAPKAAESNFFVNLIYRFFDGILAGLRALLGLSEMDELIFNKGSRGGALYEDGLMHATWWNVVLKYYTIVQLIAWMAIALAIAKTLISINMGTISANPRQRKELMDSIVEFFTVGMLLTLCIPIVRLMVQVNNGIVDVFAAGYTGDMGQSPNVPNLLVGLCMEIFMFLMTFYANFIYIMRSITIAILVAMGPICIVSMAFSKKNSIFEKWLQELSANIFLQAFHAFAFSFMFEAICQGGHMIERIAVIYAIFPITEFARNLLFQGAGGNTVSTGMKLGSAAKNMVTSAATGIAGAAVGARAQSWANVAAGGDVQKSSSITGMGGLGGSGGGAGHGGSGGGGSLAAYGNAGRALQGIRASEGAGKAEQDAVKAANRKGAFMNATANVASGVIDAVGGMASVMEGIALGDPTAVKDGSKRAGSAFAAPARAAGNTLTAKPNLEGGVFQRTRAARNGGFAANNPPPTKKWDKPEAPPTAQ